MSIQLPESIQLPRTGLAEALSQGLSQGLQNSLMLKMQNKFKADTPLTAYQQIQTALRAKELGQKEEKEKERSEEWQYAQSKDFRKELLDNYQDSIVTNMHLDQMSNLNDSGKLSAPITAAFLNKFGLPLGILNNPDSEEFDKLSKDLLKNIRTYFGARINVVEVENFLKTIPTLMNSEEGRRRIIDNLKLFMKPRQMMYEEYQNLRKDYKQKGKTLPADLQEEILDRLKPQLTELSKTFISGTSQNLGSETPNQEEMIEVISPQGKSGKIKKSQLAKALKKGYKKR